MPSGYRRAAMTLAACVCLVNGCAQPGPFTTRRGMMGTLKASNSQLSHEKAKLEQEVAELNRENQKLEDRLAQEEDANGELTARLNDAENVMSRQGWNTDALGAQAATNSSRSPAPRTLPAGRNPRKERKVPFAQIRGELKAVPYPEADPPPAEEFEAPPRSRTEDDFGPQSRLDRPMQWLPIANGVSDPTPRVR